MITLASKIDELNVGVRAHNAMKNYGVKTVADLLESDPKDMLKSYNFGKKSLREIEDALHRAGFKWKGWKINHVDCVDDILVVKVRHLEEENRRLRQIIRQICVLAEEA